VSTTELHTAVTAAPIAACANVAAGLTGLLTSARTALATTEQTLAQLAQQEETSAEDVALATATIEVGVRAHNLHELVKRALFALAGLGQPGTLDAELVDAVGAADPDLTAALRGALEYARTPESAPLLDALFAELAAAQTAADATAAVPDTMPEEWGQS